MHFSILTYNLPAKNNDTGAGQENLLAETTLLNNQVYAVYDAAVYKTDSKEESYGDNKD